MEHYKPNEDTETVATNCFLAASSKVIPVSVTVASGAGGDAGASRPQRQDQSRPKRYSSQRQRTAQDQTFAAGDQVAFYPPGESPSGGFLTPVGLILLPLAHPPPSSTVRWIPVPQASSLSSPSGELTPM